MIPPVGFGEHAIVAGGFLFYLVVVPLIIMRWIEKKRNKDE